jgi:selenide,water dikinase
VLVLGKPLGVGVMSAALKKGELGRRLRQMIATTTRLNTPGPTLAALPGVHALTDVTGFGLAGHALEWRAAPGCVQLDWAAVPLLPGVRALAGRVSSPALGPQLGRLWADVALPAPDFAPDRALLTDPQTSGGLLVSCAPATAPPGRAQRDERGSDARADRRGPRAGRAHRHRRGAADRRCHLLHRWRRPEGHRRLGQ